MFNVKQTMYNVQRTHVQYINVHYMKRISNLRQFCIETSFNRCLSVFWRADKGDVKIRKITLLCFTSYLLTSVFFDTTGFK